MPELPKIYVIGSSNTDMVIKTTKLPSAGETVIGGDFLMNPGGKGANQAVAAARLGGKVVFVARVGDDLFGRQAMEQLKKEKIDTGHVVTDPHNPSGVALIGVDGNGENSIIVAPGANAALAFSDVEKALEQLKSDDLVLLQLEIPIDTIEAVIKKCCEKNVKVILNPAPARILPDGVLSGLYVICPNETEAEFLTGVHVEDTETAGKAAEILLKKDVQNVIITLGSKGAYLHNSAGFQLIGAPNVSATDTTAAGDCFNGALAVALSEGKSLANAVTFACRAAAISVTRMGAQASIPYRKEV